jgi:hypothetical protein
MRLGVASSALKHGVSYATRIQVAKTGDLLGSDAAGLLWWVGIALDNKGYEVAGFTPDNDRHVVILIHGFPMKWRHR